MISSNNSNKSLLPSLVPKAQHPSSFTRTKSPIPHASRRFPPRIRTATSTTTPQEIPISHRTPMTQQQQPLSPVDRNILIPPQHQTHIPISQRHRNSISPLSCQFPFHSFSPPVDGAFPALAGGSTPSPTTQAFPVTLPQLLQSSRAFFDATLTQITQRVQADFKAMTTQYSVALLNERKEKCAYREGMRRMRCERDEAVKRLEEAGLRGVKRPREGEDDEEECEEGEDKGEKGWEVGVGLGGLMTPPRTMGSISSTSSNEPTLVEEGGGEVEVKKEPEPSPPPEELVLPEPTMNALELMKASYPSPFSSPSSSPQLPPVPLPPSPSGSNKRRRISASPPAPQQPQLSTTHLQLIYFPLNAHELICRMCLPPSPSLPPASLSPSTITTPTTAKVSKFPRSTTPQQLSDHCLLYHPEQCIKLSRMGRGEVESERRRVVEAVEGRNMKRRLSGASAVGAVTAVQF